MTALEKIARLRGNLEKYQADLPNVVLDSVKDNEHTILDLNTEEQLYAQGIYRDGTPIEPAYRPMTISIKQSKGQPTSRVTLKDTGDFQKSFFIAYGGDSFSIGATDPKTRKLEKKYGSDIFGLTSENLKEAIKEMKPDIFQRSLKIIYS